MQEWRTQQKERLLTELQEGEIQRGKITSIREFGIFVDLGGADGLVHLSELSWDRGKSPDEMFQVGDEVDVYILKVDQESRKIALSLRRAQPEQWEGLIDKYEVGQIVTGQVTKLAPFGAFARLEGPLEGVTHPQEVVKEGDTLPLKIVRIERHRHRLGLSLKQARPQAEEMGYVFDENGGVVALPGQEAPQRPREEVAAELDEESAAALGAQLTPEMREQLVAEVAEASEEAAAEESEEAPEEAAAEESEEAPEEAAAEESEEAPEEAVAEESEEALEEPVAEESEEAPEEAAAEESEETLEEAVAEVAEAPEEPAAEESEEALEEPVAEESGDAPEEAAAEESEEAPEEAEAAPPGDAVPERQKRRSKAS
jgi:small subunit ribosomal protein S1